MTDNLKPDWTPDATDIAGRILVDLGIGCEPSREPHVDPRRDRLAAIIQIGLDAHKRNTLDEAAAAVRAAVVRFKARKQETATKVIIVGLQYALGELDDLLRAAAIRARTQKEAVDADPAGP